MGLVQAHFGLKPLAYSNPVQVYTAHTYAFGNQDMDLKSSETLCTKSTDIGGMIAESCTYTGCGDA